MALTGVLAATVVGATPGSAGTTVIDLRTDAHTRIIGAELVAGAGDVNGDGIPDILVSKADPDGAANPHRGRSWVVFGARPMPPRIDLAELGDHGFVIEGADQRDDAALIAPTGDINGDGLDDILVGAPGADNNARFSSGTAYVVFGKATAAPVLLALFDAGTQGRWAFASTGRWGAIAPVRTSPG